MGGAEPGASDVFLCSGKAAAPAASKPFTALIESFLLTGVGIQDGKRNQIHFSLTENSLLTEMEKVSEYIYFFICRNTFYFLVHSV